MVKFVKFRASDILPNPAEVLYWVDLNTDPLGGSIKVYNAEGEWETIKVLQGTLPEFEKKIKQWVTELLNRLEGEVDAKISEFEGTIAVINDSIETLKATKQDNLTAGYGIAINNNVVTCIVDLSLYKVVTELPTDPKDIDTNKIYLLLNSSGPAGDLWSEYIYVNNKWELIGEYKAPIDLTPYLTKELAAETYQLIGDYAVNDDLDAVDAKLDTEIARAKAAEIVLNKAIDTEEDRALLAEAVLRTNLAAEVDRATEVETNLDTDIKDEAARAIAKEDAIDTAYKAADSSITTNLNNEITRATELEAELRTDLTTETTRAKAAEEALSTRVDNVNANVIVLDTKVDSEIARATEAETTISSNLTSEVNRAIAAEGALESSITTEITRAKAEEKRIDNKVDAHVTDSARIEAESKTRDTALGTRVDTEVTDRKAADTVVTNSITAEVARAKAAEKANADNIVLANNAITAEETQRKAADADLLTKVNTKVASVTVVKDPTNNLHYTLMVDNVNKGDINIPKDLFLKSASYDTATKELVFVFETSDGESISRVGVGSLVDTYTAGNGLNLASNKFSITVDPGTESFLTVTTTGIKVTGITTAINSAVATEKNRAVAAEAVLTNGKVDKVTGKQLSTEDYTTVEKTKLAGLSNYNDASIRTLISTKANTADVYTKTVTYSRTEVDSLISDSGSFDPTKYYTATQIDGKLFVKQDTLVSGTNIKTLANQAILGTGNITLANIGAEPMFTKNTAFNKNFGTAVNTVCLGNDARLSDARPASDVSTWAKAPNKPSYTPGEVNAVNKAGDIMSGILRINSYDPAILVTKENKENVAFGYSLTFGGYIYNYNGDKYLAISNAGVPNLSGSTIWHEGNDGAGSGLDADTLDGRQSDSFFRNGIETIQIADVDKYVNRKSGTYNVNNAGTGTELLTVFNAGNYGSVSSLEFRNKFNGFFQYRVGIDINRYSQWFNVIRDVDCSETAVGNSIVKRNDAGDIISRYVYCTADYEDGLPIDSVNFGNGTDGFIRKCSLARFREQLASVRSLAVVDYRTAVIKNNTFGNMAVSAFFHNIELPAGLTNWVSGIHVKGWDGEYRSWEIGSHSGVNADFTKPENNRLYFRNTASPTVDSVFNPWKALAFVEDIPTKLPNPTTLTFTGAVSGTYDGSVAKTINIPTIAGPKGDTGAQGPVGPTGPKGADGAKGATGSTGATGALGIQGIQGLVGALGPKGDAGARGSDGAVGALGSQGILGPQGERGLAGPSGSLGATGPSGTNATITEATVTALSAGSNPTITLGGTASARTFAFGIPRGYNGSNGVAGINGADGRDGVNAIIDGASATINNNVGTPNVGVTLSGTPSNRTFNFQFNNLKGNPGTNGTNGANGNSFLLGKIAALTTGVSTDRLAVGVAGQPTIDLAIGNLSTGFNSVGADSIQIMIAGVNIGYISASGLHLTGQVHAAGGFFKDSY